MPVVAKKVAQKPKKESHPPKKEARQPTKESQKPGKKLKKEGKRVIPSAMPEVGSKVSGTVLDSGSKGVFVSIEGVYGRVKLCDISTRFITGDEVATLFPKGSELENMTVVGITADQKLELKMERKIGEPEVGSVHKAVVKRVERYGVLMGFTNSLARCLCERREVDDDETKIEAAMKKIQAGHKYSVKVIRVENGQYWVSMKQSLLGDNAGYTQQVKDFVETENTTSTETVAPRPSLIDEAKVKGKKRAAEAVASVDPLEDDSIEASAAAPSKKQAKKQKDLVKSQKEESIREKETHLLSGDWRSNPQSPEEFERLLLVEAHSAQTWIKFMSYWLKMAEVGKARETAERALKHTIAESEKFNLWIAYLNMESVFGGNADALFLRAVQYCDPKAVHHAMAQVWIRAENFEKAKSALERTVAKFHESRKAWLNLIEFLFAQNQFEEARAVLPKALKSLPDRKHVRVTVKFAQLEYRSGHPERGSTVFETLISKRGAAKTDIWSVYFDEQIKASTGTGDLSAVRELFERAVALRIKPFKMKFFFKRWMDFETQWGTPETVEDVKAKAVAYVESVGQ